MMYMYHDISDCSVVAWVVSVQKRRRRRKKKTKRRKGHGCFLHVGASLLKRTVN